MSNESPEMGTVDVSVMLPDHDAVPEGQILRPSQQRRVEALLQARKILENRQALFAASKVTAQSTVGDLTYLAEWILIGSSVPDEDLGVDEVKRTWRLGYSEGVHAALANAPGITGEQADQIKSQLGLGIDGPEPTSDSGTWEPGPPSYPSAPDYDDDDDAPQPPRLETDDNDAELPTDPDLDYRH